MKISDRLYKIYEQVNKDTSVADIGTDHGYVPILLLQNNISPYVIMSDISEKSLNKAIENFNSNCQDKRAYFRVGNGLNTLLPSEVDEIIIAGIGGNLIIDILSNDINKTFSYKEFILQPRNNSGKLRNWLVINGFSIDKEVLAKEGKFVNEIIVASPFDQIDKANSKFIPDSDDIRWEFPETFRNCDYELLKEKVDWKINSILQEITNLKKSKIEENKLIHKLKGDIEYLNSFII